uniref:Biogenesis of lysosome-related organelles complex 1 subunit 4-like n=1 Tax=Phallusia mammillata TaxID=59560 RepID=A0A6F9D8E1_9ASCI|nr:biogenesis of lysosome-related organelles complex 1 subunit 4-like [Phallusia mammillata]
MASSPTISSSDVGLQTAEEYSKLLSISSDVQLDAIDTSIESVLTRLDELYGMLDMIRTDNALATEQLLPLVQAKIHSLDPVFKQIDQLEAFVVIVKQNVAQFEAEVKKKENDYSALTSLKNAFSNFSFLGRKKKPTPSVSPRNSTPYEPIPIFSTSQYIATKEQLNEVSDSELPI